MRKMLQYQKKIFNYFLFFEALFLIASGLLFFQYNISTIKENIRGSNTRFLETGKKNFEQRLDEMDKKARSVHASSTIMTVLSKIEYSDENYFDRYPRDNDAVKNVLYSLFSTENINGQLGILSRFGDFTFINNFTYTTIPSPREMLEDSYIRKVLSGEENSLFIPPHQANFREDDYPVITLVRGLRNSFHTFGVLRYSRSLDYFFEPFEYEEANNRISIMILDGKGEFQASNSPVAGKGFIPSDIGNRIMEQSSGIVEIENSNGSFFASFSRIESTGWYLVAFEDMSLYKGKIRGFLLLFLSVYLSIFLLLTLVIRIITNQLAMPITRLKETIEHLSQDEEISIQPPVNNNEIAMVSAAIEDLLVEIQEKNRRLEEARKREIRTHLEIIEAQMNPHFLYNILNVIGAYGQLSGAENVYEMCRELVHILRYSLELNQESVPLKEELKNISGYLYLMKMRYGDFLNYTVETDPSFDHFQVPKLILQPFVENCFKHAFQKADPPWNIKITSGSDEKGWFINMENNGSVFPREILEDTLEQINKLKKEFRNRIKSERPTEHLGIVNTVLRMNLFFEGNEIFRINTKEETTTVSIGGPFLWNP